ncbi:MAG TPA: hypothetical protein VK590_04230 [Saprospiraceae bacterium]|nr:hypothetical protein [Saprospiraceae bacterium]
MPTENYEIVGSYNNQRITNIDSERTINMFEYLDAKGKKKKTLISTSGILDTGFIFPDSNPTDFFRGEFVLNEFQYVVIGRNIYRIDFSNTVLKINTILLDDRTGYVGIDANNASPESQILFVDGNKGYAWDTATLQYTPDMRTVDPAFPASPIDVCFIDGFLLVAHGGTNQFQLSAFNNVYSWGLVESTTVTFDNTTNLITPNTGTVYVTGVPVMFAPGTAGVLPPEIIEGDTYYAIFVSPLTIRVATSLANALTNTFVNFTTDGTPPNTITNLAGSGLPGQLQLGTINSHPGNIVACRTLHRRVFLFSANYTEIWENSGLGTNLPLRRNNGLLMEYGTPAIGSVVTGFDKLIFLSQDRDGLGAVMEVIGTESIPISNRALDFQLAQYAALDQIDDARGIFIKENGIIFYRLNFTEANHTFVYDVTLSNPTVEEGKLWHEEQTLDGNRHPAQTHGYFNGKNYYGSYDSPILYQVDSAFITNNGEAIPRIRIGEPVVVDTYNRRRIDRFQLDVVQGLANITDISSVLDLLTEDSNILTTELGVDLLLEGSLIQATYNLSNPPIFLSVSKDGGVTYGYRQESFMGAIVKEHIEQYGVR